MLNWAIQYIYLFYSIPRLSYNNSHCFVKKNPLFLPWKCSSFNASMDLTAIWCDISSTFTQIKWSLFFAGCGIRQGLDLGLMLRFQILNQLKKEKKKHLKLKECSAVVTLWFGCHYHMSFCWLMKWSLTVWPAANIISVLSKMCQYFFDFPVFLLSSVVTKRHRVCLASQAETSAGSDKEIVHIRRSRWEEGEEKQHLMLALGGG